MIARSYTTRIHEHVRVESGAPFGVQRLSVGDKALVDQVVYLLRWRAVLPSGENRKLVDGVKPERVALAEVVSGQSSRCSAPPL